MKYLTLLITFIFFAQKITAQDGYKALPPTNFEDATPPPSPNYSNPDHWAALPEREDMADVSPGYLKYGYRQKDAKVDVFFVHPTIYVGYRKGEDQWNADVNDVELNKEVDNSTIKNQASAFNLAGRVYAPRYRQAHIYSYYTRNQEAGKKALDFAYQDVKSAFEYYMKHYNKGRPFILASHSQGTTHTGRLMLEMIDNQSIQEQLVAAYIVGIPIPKDSLKSIPLCETPTQTGCYCAWRTWLKEHYPDEYDPEIDKKIAVTNPLTWRTDDMYAPKELNKGAVLRNFNKISKNLVDAQVHQGILWATRPKVFGARFFGKNYHVGDINLYYMNIRENALERVKAYFDGRR